MDLALENKTWIDLKNDEWALFTNGYIEEYVGPSLWPWDNTAFPTPLAFDQFAPDFLWEL